MLENLQSLLLAKLASETKAIHKIIDTSQKITDDLLVTTFFCALMYDFRVINGQLLRR